MAKKDNLGLLQEIIGQLRTLNRSSVRDQLRENEATKRSEALMGQGEIAEEQQSAIIGGAEDFQRRFLAGQAKTFTDKTLQKTGSKLDIQLQIREFNLLSLEQLQQLNVNTKWIVDNLPGVSIHVPKPDKLSSIDIDTLKAALKTNEHLQALLASDNKRNDELDRQRNNDLRSAKEARIEGIRNAGKGAGGIGAGFAGGGLNDDEDGGGSSSAKTAFMTIAGSWLLAKLVKMKNWFKGLAGAIGKMGTKLFKGKGFKLTGPQAKMARNPRLWPILLAGLIAASFMKSADDVEAEWDSEAGGDAQDSARSGGQDNAVWSATGSVLNAVVWTSLLAPLVLKTRIGNAMSKALTRSFKAAPKGSLRHRMWAKGAGRFAARGALRFMGPWGFAAWAVWTIVDWQLDKQKQVAIAMETELNAAIKEDMNEGEFQSFMDNDDLFKDFKFKDGPIPMDLSGQGAIIRDNKIKEKVKALMAGRTAEQIEFIKRGLIEQGGWSEGKLNTILKQIGYDEENAERDLARAAFLTMKNKKPHGNVKDKNAWMLQNNPEWLAFESNQAAIEKQTMQRNLFNRANNPPFTVVPITEKSTTYNNTSFYVEGYQAAEMAVAIEQNGPWPYTAAQ